MYSGSKTSLQGSQIFQGKGSQKNLVLELSENESIIESIKQGMAENKISRAEVKDMQGKIKEVTVNFMLGSKFKSKEMNEAKVNGASGHYELKTNSFFGNLHIVIEDSGKLNAFTLVKAKAVESLKIMLSFIEIKE